LILPSIIATTCEKIHKSAARATLFNHFPVSLLKRATRSPLIEIAWEEIAMHKAAFLFTSLLLSIGALVFLTSLSSRISPQAFTASLAPANETTCESIPHLSRSLHGFSQPIQQILEQCPRSSLIAVLEVL
jgi:hypothetical protein